MTPAEVHLQAHHHILSCAEMLTVVLAAVEGRMIHIPQEHKDASRRSGRSLVHGRN